jgi:hypothetical protein
MKSTIMSRRDLDFLLYEWLHVEELTALDRFAEHSRETFDGVLDLSEQLATRYFAPHNKLSDANEPSFDGQTVTLIPEVKKAWDAFAAADLLARFGSPEQIETFVKPMLAGRFSGTMALSETQAGSSLADITTRAEPAADGSYRLFGSKMWISGAEHELTDNIVNLVLAKIPGGPAGTKGISLFIVPKYLADGTRNGVGHLRAESQDGTTGYRQHRAQLRRRGLLSGR